MKVITAPEPLGPDAAPPRVFLAGGITGCPPWQDEMIELLKDTDLTLLNPRRPNFPIDNPQAAREQITWEYRMLLTADARLFWFCAEAIQPIALFELGRWSAPKTGPLFVGVHPDYPRRQDVMIQLECVKPLSIVSNDLEALAKRIKNWVTYGWVT